MKARAAILSADADYVEKFKNIRWDVIVNTPEEFGRIIASERESMREVIQQANITIN